MMEVVETVRPGSVLEVEPSGFADGSEVGCDSKRRVRRLQDLGPEQLEGWSSYELWWEKKNLQELLLWLKMGQDQEMWIDAS